MPMSELPAFVSTTKQIRRRTSNRPRRPNDLARSINNIHVLEDRPAQLRSPEIHLRPRVLRRAPVRVASCPDVASPNVNRQVSVRAEGQLAAARVSRGAGVARCARAPDCRAALAVAADGVDDEVAVRLEDVLRVTRGEERGGVRSDGERSWRVAGLGVEALAGNEGVGCWSWVWDWKRSGENEGGSKEREGQETETHGDRILDWRIERWGNMG